jgi:hypothetical protein
MYTLGEPIMDESIAQMYSLVGEICGFVRGAGQNMEIGEVERHLLSMVMKMGKQALISYTEKKGSGYLGKEIVNEQGERLPYVSNRKCKYISIFGEIEICRSYYQRKGESGVFPLASDINLPNRGYSYFLQEISSKLAVNGSYEKACEVFGDIFPVNIPLRSLERIVGDTCEDVARYYEEKPSPELSSEAVITVATVDKKGVVIRKPEPDETSIDTVSADPNKPGKKKMSTEIAAYTTKRHIRSVDDVCGEFIDKKRPSSKPKPQVKQVWGSLMETPEQTVARLGEAITRRLCWTSELVCVLDGEKSLWRLVYQYFPMAFFVLDIFHVLEYIAQAAHCFHKEKSPEARKFIRERLKMLLTGNVGKMIGGLKQTLTKRSLSKSQKYTLNKVIGYLERNKQHMPYDVCLERGYPIGSGVIEGTCRNLINDRLELTGMRWTIQGAESIIRLRAAYLNKDWKDFWKFRRASELRRLYGSHLNHENDIYHHEVQKAA